MTVSGKTLLFIENDPETRDEIMAHFALRNTVLIADSVRRARECLALFNCDMIIADADLPDGVPFDLYTHSDGVPPLILYTWTKNDEEIIEWLRRGAVDYLIRPSSIKLLEAKISIRLPKNKTGEKTVGDFAINKSTRSVSYMGTPISLTSSEYNILIFLIENKGVFFSSDEIYERIWLAKALNTVTIRKHISSLRRKLLSSTGGRDYIHTDFGKGYAFVADDE